MLYMNICKNTGKAAPHRHSLVPAVCWRRPESLKGEQHKQGGLTIPFWVTCGVLSALR